MGGKRYENNPLLDRSMRPSIRTKKERKELFCAVALGGSHDGTGSVPMRTGGARLQQISMNQGRCLMNRIHNSADTDFVLVKMMQIGPNTKIRQIEECI
jgi:hypothetical protein